MNRRFDLVVFDVGSVLVEAGRTLAEEIALAGFAVDPAWLEQFDARLHALPRPNVGAIDIAHYAVLFADASDGVFSEHDALRIANASLVAEYAGIDAVFDACDVAGIETALLCNVQDAEWARLFPGEGLESEFPTLGRARYRFASHLIGAKKPDARAYLEVQRVTGRAAQQILFFDDRDENVDAARDRGWTAELIDYRGDTAGQLLQLLRRHEVIV